MVHLFLSAAIARLAASSLVGATVLAQQGATVLPSEMPETPLSVWEVRAGDALVVDTQKNIGYLIHENSGYTSFPLITGQRRWVWYIGRSYNATTPVRRWVATSVDIKGDRTTFGPRGIFLRLQYKDEDTPYGIHSHRSVERMMTEYDRFGSMGCIIVKDEILDLLLDTFERNGKKMTVRTVYGLGEAGANYASLQSLIENGV